MASIAASATDANHSAAAGVTGGDDGDSVEWKFWIAFFAGLTIYNGLELVAVILFSFSHYRGVYFWSLLVSSIGLIPYATGFTFKFFYVIRGRGSLVSVGLLTIGWYTFIPGQSVVLWSRLHLILTGERADRVLKYTKWMIIIDASLLHVPTTVVTFGSNNDLDTAGFVKAHNVIEKYQMTGFFGSMQKAVPSSIYIIETSRTLRHSLRPETNRPIYQLICVNVLIIGMDIGLLTLEYASLFMLETIVKGFTYSIQLKLEFAILSRLVKFVSGDRKAPVIGNRSMTFVNLGTGDGLIETGTRTSDWSEFVDLSKVASDYTHAYPGRSHSFSRSVANGLAERDIWEDNAKV